MIARYLPPRYSPTRVLSKRVQAETLQVRDLGLRDAYAVIQARFLAPAELESASDGAVQQFLASARVAQIVRSGWIATPYTCGIFAGPEDSVWGYTTRSFIPGVSLAELSCPLPFDALLGVSYQLSCALRAVHEAGLLHLDLKSGNVIVRRSLQRGFDDQSRCVLIDIGCRGQRRASTDGVVSNVSLCGTAPELLQGADASELCDLYSLGCLMYRLASGRSPFSGRTVGEIVSRQRQADYARLNEVQRDLPSWFTEMVDGLLEPVPENRVQSAEELSTRMEATNSRDALTRRLAPFDLSTVYRGHVDELRSCVELSADVCSRGQFVSMEVAAQPGIGVTWLLRELQDATEAHGTIVLTARPCQIAGVPVFEQLRNSVDGILRTGRGPTVGAGAVDLQGEFADAHIDLAGDVLDDILVARRQFDIGIFIDDWTRCDVRELEFLNRLLRQLNAPSSERSSGSAFVALGSTDSQATHGQRVEESRLLVHRTVSLAPMQPQQVMRFARRELGIRDLNSADATRLCTSTGGAPGAVFEALADRVRAARSQLGAVVSRIGEAEEKCRTGRASAKREVESHSSAEWGQFASSLLAAYGQEVPLDDWQWFCRHIGVSPDELETHVSRRIPAGEVVVKANPSSASDANLPVPIDEEFGSGVDAFARILRRRSKQVDVRAATGILEYIVRVGSIPEPLRWPVVRGFLMLLANGRAAEVEHYAASLCRQFSRHPDRLRWELFFRSARVAMGASICDAEFDSGSVPRMRAPQKISHLHLTGESAWRSGSRERALRFFRCAEKLAARARVPVGSGAGVDIVCASVDLQGIRPRTRELAARLSRQLRRLRSRRISREEPLGSGVWSLRGRNGHSRRLLLLLRMRCRLAYGRGQFDRAIRFAEREADLAARLAFTARSASASNNAAAALAMSGRNREAVSKFQAAADERALLDDERGLASVLSNLGLVYSRLGDYSRAIVSLSRARVLAARNGQARLERTVGINLANAHCLRGHYRDAYRILSLLLRSDPKQWDGVARREAIYLAGLTALDLGFSRIASRWHRQLKSIDDASGVKAGRYELLGAQIARRQLRPRDAARIARDAHGDDRELRAFGSLVAAELGESKLDAIEDELTESGIARDRTMPAGIRLWAIRVSRNRRRRVCSATSLARIVRWGERYGAHREVLEWVNDHLSSVGRGFDQVGLTSLLHATSSRRLKEGHGDLRVMIGARLAAALCHHGRHAEATRMIDGALMNFEVLERRARRDPGIHRIVSTVHRQFRDALRGATRAPTQASPRVVGLRAAAFSVLSSASGSSCYELQAGDRILLRVAQSLVDGGASASTLSEICRVAIESTGAQRCLLITRGDGGLVVQSIAPGEAQLIADEGAQLSWAVVSEVMRTGEASVATDAISQGELSGHRSIAVLNLRSLAAIPLVQQSETIGVLYLDHQGVAGLFGEKEVALLRGLAAILGMCVRVERLADTADERSDRLELTERQLLRAHRTAVAGELIAGRAHDLKNVLSAITARCQLLRRGEVPANVERSVGAVESASQIGIEILERLQGCVRGSPATERSRLDLGALVRECVELITPTLRDGSAQRIECRVRTASGCYVEGDAGDFRELVINLLINACDAMPNGGELEVDVELDCDGSSASIRVRDSGAGMSRETQARLFEPFFTTKGEGGTGLGLAVVRSVVVKYGGEIQVESALGRGSTITALIPLAECAGRLSAGSPREGGGPG